jgi:ribA/ribD-fused uncharacterized protein
LKSKKNARKYQKLYQDKWDSSRWESGYKDYIMRRGLVFKFDQNRHMIDGLLKTENAKLVERSDKDPYWGGFLPNSLNKLGKFLMELRENIKCENAIYLNENGIEKIYLK